MMKRVLSFLLCLIMVVGLAAPSVQASSIDNSSTSSVLDGVYISGDTNGTVIVDGEDVTEEVKDNTLDNIPAPGKVMTPTTAPSTPVVVDLCKCVDLSNAEDHPGVCKVKAPYIELCNTASEPELHKKWASYNHEEQILMQEYLRETLPLKLVELERLLAAPTGSASETLSDGTTVSVEGIPEHSSLNIVEATDEVKDIVNAYVSEKESTADSTELFSYDVSVQDAEGSEWQPDTSVKMELELPGEKLHKYSKVYVVHVDDSGEATTIEAEVTEDGKIAFETPGFSTFAGFTVDFDYEGAKFSMKGLTAIKLSELFDRLKMPLNAEDVVNVEYTDYTQIQVEQLEGDWLLTSLKAFTTEEKLTLTMADGAVYQIKVTDAITTKANFYMVTYAGETYTNCWIDGNNVSGGNAEVQLFLDGDGQPTSYDLTSSQAFDFATQPLVIDGRGVGGCMEIILQKASGVANNATVYWNLFNLKIIGGAKVVIRLGSTFTGGETVVIRRIAYYNTSSHTEAKFDPRAMFDIQNGSLYFNLDSNDSSLTDGTGMTSESHSNANGVTLKIDGGTATQHKGINKQCALFYCGLNAKNLVINDVTFENSEFRAIYCLADLMSILRLRNCTFSSSITYCNAGGGAIRIDSRTQNTDYPETTNKEVQVYDLDVISCTFNSNTAAITVTNTDAVYDGGAFSCTGNLDNTYFYDCDFTNCKAWGRGGAVNIGNNQSAYNMGYIKFENCDFSGCESLNGAGGGVMIRDGNVEYIWFENCTFTNMTGYSHCGGVNISINNDPASINQYVKFNKCTFTNCDATNNGGGALRLLLSGGKPVTISNCSFSDCGANTHGGAIYFPEAEAAVLGDVDITDCTFSKDVAKAYGGAICVYSRTATLDITGGSFADCKAGTVVASSGAVDALGNQHYNGNGGGGAIMITRKHGAINIGGTSTKKQTFTNCESLNNGGAIAFEGGTNPSTEIQRCNIQYVEIDGCKARDGGSAICMSSVTIVDMSIKDSTIKNCTYVSGYTGTEANKNSLYDDLYTKDMDYNSVPFRMNDSHGTIRTNGAVKAQLVVEGVTFSKNTSVTGGAGIYWNANRLTGYKDDTDGTYTFTNSLAVRKCTFEENYAFRDGGAIYVESSLTVEGCTFKKNSAQRGGAIAQQIYNNYGRDIESGETNNLVIKSYTSGSTTTKSVLEENYARNHGGAVSVLCNSTISIKTTADAAALAYPITCEITDAEIKNNRAAENGGGVYFYQMEYPADFGTGSVYDDNNNKLTTAEQIAAQAVLNNKEVEAYVKSLKLDGATIYSNYSGCGKDHLTTPASANGSGNGGGIYLKAKKNTTLQVLGCTVYSNTAHYGNGGGVYMSGEGGVCQIKSNAAGRTTEIGGAANKGNKATSSAPGTTAGQNTGNGGGIGIFIKGRIEMQGGTVSYNTADTSGGGIAVNGSTMEFTDGTVTNNAALYGGGISLTNSGDPTTIADQSLANPPALTPAWGMVFTNGTVTYNLADIGGGICISNNSTMKLDGGKVWNNQAATKSGTTYAYKDGQNGGGIAVVSGSKMNVYAGEVKRNHARNGGGITVQGGSSLQMLPKVGSTAAGTVSNNTAHSNNTSYQGCGGGIYLAAKADSSAKNTLYVDHGTISSNTARYGGGIALMQNAEATLQGGSIDHNKGTDPANSLGGGAYVYGGKLTISGAELSYNYGQNSGGAVYLRTTSGSIPAELSVTGGTIHHNHTRTGWGGGIYMLGQDCVTTVSGGKIYENYTEESGSNGGGINAEHNCTLNINGGEIYSNRAASNGGGINSHSSAIINIDGGAIYKNTAASNGGGINAHSSAVINIDGGAIYKNTATAGTGGGIYAYYYTTMTITGGDIYSNKAATHGGGMHVSEYSRLTFNGGDIRNNTAGRGGGGITVSWHSNATVSTSTDGKKIGKIMNNTAAMGGGLYVECSDLTVRNGYIINNKAVGQPAATEKTVYQKPQGSLYGVGGGVCLTGFATAPGTFTLTGDQIAIYGNTADFAADDVCSNGLYTKLDIPTVVQMNLADYDFRAEGWVEDYCKDDSKYNLGLNMINLHADSAPDADKDAIRNMGVTRFRNTPSTNRKYMLVEPEYVSGKKPDNTPVSGEYANKANAYVCLTLGIPGAADDTVVLDYGTTVNVNLIDNDLFVNEEDFQYGELGLGIPDGVNEKYGIHYSSAKDANGKDVDHLGTFSGTKMWNDKLSNGAAFLNSSTGIITYNYNYGNGQLSFKETETFAYTVKHGSSWFYAKITVVPATTIYYEDTAAQVTYHTESSKESLATWETIGQSLGTAQDQDRPGEALIGSLDADSIYGYDSKRGSTTAYSDGGAHLVTVSHEHNAEDDNNDDFCDKCNHALSHDWVDIKIEAESEKTDGRCDVCGAGLHLSHTDTCTDIDKNWFCDFCGKRVGRGDNNARASFTFTGTGFDIISYCSAKTGIVMATVYKGEVNVDTIADNDAEFGKRYVASYIVDTYYGYKQDSNGKWVLDAESTDTLYQVPVIKADLTKVVVVQDDHNTKDVDETEYKNYGYGTYTVELYVAPSFLEREAGYWGADFYLDAIRIYNPAGDESGIYVTDEPKLDKNGKIIRDQYGQPVFKTTTVDNSAVRDVHKADKEGWPVYTELRNMFISQKNLGVTTTEGIIFIDGKTETSVADYSSWGPNNEVYLNPQQHIAFTMDMQGCTNVDAIHIGMRGLTGTSGVTIAYGTSVNDAFPVLTQNLSTTDMYYSISMKDSKGNFCLADKVVVITNSGSKPIAISNIKVTHSAAPTYQTAKMMFKVSKQTAEIALGILNAQQLSEPTVTPKYPALSYNGMICYNVFFSAEDLGDLTAADLGLAVFDSYDPEGTVETARDVIMGATQIDGLYMVATKGVNAKYLGDTQYFRAFAKKADGSFIYSKMVSYSAVDYAKNVLAKSDDVKLKQLVVAMLNYGAEAQKFFGYKTDDLMNKDLTADDQALLAGFDASSLNGVQKVDPAKVGDFASTGGFTRRSPAISFNGAFEINYFFTPAHAPDGDMVLYFWSEDTYNSITELTYDNADKIVEVSTKDGTYTATSDEIIARQLDQTMYVAAVYRSYGETYCSGVLPYSIAAYCQKPPAGVQALATAAAVYGCTAKQFFGE